MTAALSLFPSYTPEPAVEQDVVSITDRNRRLTPEVIRRAPLVLHGRVQQGWDLDAAGEAGGAVCERFITAEDDALGPRSWVDYLDPSRRITGHPSMCRVPPLTWGNFPFLDPAPSRESQWKVSWVNRAIAESSQMVMWVLLSLAGDRYCDMLDAAADCTIDIAYRARFPSPAGLPTASPMAHRHRLWRLVPRGWRDMHTGWTYSLRELERNRLYELGPMLGRGLTSARTYRLEVGA